MRIGIYVFDEVEVLDFAGPFEVFSTAGRLQERDGVPSDDRLSPSLVSVGSTVSARGGLVVRPRWLLRLAPRLDLLVVPGGIVAAELENELALDWIRSHAAHSPIASVCTGSFLLAQAGLLDGRRATTHWAECDDLEARYPAVQVERDVRFVDDGDVITAAGVAAGIDMSLHLVERFGGRALAEETARLTEVALP